MKFYVVVWQIGFEDAQLVYEDYAYGPFLDEGRAFKKRQQIERALERRGISHWDVSVQEMAPGSYPANEIVASLVAQGS